MPTQRWGMRTSGTLRGSRVLAAAKDLVAEDDVRPQAHDPVVREPAARQRDDLARQDHLSALPQLPMLHEQRAMQASVQVGESVDVELEGVSRIAPRPALVGSHIPLAAGGHVRLHEAAVLGLDVLSVPPVRRRVRRDEEPVDLLAARKQRRDV